MNPRQLAVALQHIDSEADRAELQRLHAEMKRLLTQVLNYRSRCWALVHKHRSPKPSHERKPR